MSAAGRCRRLICSALVLFTPILATAAETKEGRRQFFLERSYFFVAFPHKSVLAAPPYYTETERQRDDGDMLFEALPAPHLFFLNQLDRKDLQFGTRGELPDPPSRPLFLGDRWVLSFTFLARLRQLGGFSSPLRNPSFMPRFSVQRLSVTNSTPGDLTRKSRLRVFGPQLVLWGHHSNGGAGCLFLEDPEPDCATDIPPERRTVNTRNGSFSTNYVKLAYSFLQGRPDSTGNWMQHSWTISGWVELNPSGWGPGALEDGQRAIYGPQRFGVSIDLQRGASLLGGKWNLSLNPSYEYIRFDKKPAVESSPHRWIVDVSAAKDEGTFRGWGLVVRFYQGQDFNNLLFVRDIRRVQIGLVVDPQTRRLKE